MTRPFVLGITGGIGSGKSYISSILMERFGVHVYDTDSRAKRLNETDETIQRALIELVGEDVYNENGLVKPVLAKYLFSSQENASKVNAIVHPAVKRDFITWLTLQAGEDIVAVESAILYESGFGDLTDEVLFVDAPQQLRLERAVRRDNSTQEQVLRRIRLQDIEVAKMRSRYVICNDGRLDSMLQNELRIIITNIKNRI